LKKSEQIKKVSTKKAARRKLTPKKKAAGKVPKPYLFYHRAFHSALLRYDRDVIIWLPPQYDSELKRRFPVLYMHDGQNILDPATAYIGVDWQIDESALRLLKGNLIEPFIIVGIYNTPDRLEEYGETEAGERFRKFIVEELKSFIDAEYRTLTEPEHTAVMGSSMGGLCAMLMAWKHPEVFGKAACLSSSFYYGNEKVFKTIENSRAKPRIRVYIDSGEDGKRDAQKMFNFLSAAGFIIGDDLDYFYNRGAMHTESAWANRLDRPLRFLFPKR
jgi:predicted alpha/beta superfamily hydrolase